jgi:hypothetical protein
MWQLIPECDLHAPRATLFFFDDNHTADAGEHFLSMLRFIAAHTDVCSVIAMWHSIIAMWL